LARKYGWQYAAQLIARLFGRTGRRTFMEMTL
jgi:hypothetical protein